MALLDRHMDNTKTINASFCKAIELQIIVGGGMGGGGSHLGN